MKSTRLWILYYCAGMVPTSNEDQEMEELGKRNLQVRNVEYFDGPETRDDENGKPFFPNGLAGSIPDCPEYRSIPHARVALGLEKRARAAQIRASGETPTPDVAARLAEADSEPLAPSAGALATRAEQERMRAASSSTEAPPAAPDVAPVNPVWPPAPTPGTRPGGQ